MPTDKNSAPAPTDSILLVRQTLLRKQRAEDAENVAVVQEPPVPGAALLPVDGPKTFPVDLPAQKTRFYGVKTISSDKIALDFKNISDEVLANLRQPGASLIVKVEIEGRMQMGLMRTPSAPFPRTPKL